MAAEPEPTKLDLFWLGLKREGPPKIPLEFVLPKRVVDFWKRFPVVWDPKRLPGFENKPTFLGSSSFYSSFFSSDTSGFGLSSTCFTSAYFSSFFSSTSFSKGFCYSASLGVSGFSICTCGQAKGLGLVSAGVAGFGLAKGLVLFPLKFPNIPPEVVAGFEKIDVDLVASSEGFANKADVGGRANGFPPIFPKIDFGASAGLLSLSLIGSTYSGFFSYSTMEGSGYAASCGFSSIFFSSGLLYSGFCSSLLVKVPISLNPGLSVLGLSSLLAQ